VIDLMKKNKITLETYRDKPFLNHHLSGCRFYDYGDLAIVWKAKRSIACGISGEIKAYEITKGQKLMILDACGLLTQWNLNTLSFGKQYQLEWAIYTLKIDLFIFNKDFSLLAVCLQVSVYLTENAMILSHHKFERDESLLHSEFISFDGEERLLLFFEGSKVAVEIRDPYCLERVNYVATMSKLCKDLSEYLNILESEFNVIINEKIYSILDGSLQVQEISKILWRKYLREKLGDYDKIRSLPNKSQIEEFLSIIIENIANEDDIIIPDIKDVYAGLLKARKFDKDNNKWESVGSEWNISPVHIKESKFIVYRCKLLGNEDLAMITSIGLLIWSIWKKNEIRLRYYKGFPFQATYLYEKDYENRYILGIYKSEQFYEKEFEAKKSHIKKLLNEIQKYEKNSLPPTDFDTITLFHDILFMDGRSPFKELLDDYLEDKLILAFNTEKNLHTAF
ncbi:28263_t:CDS:2, partial [Racocetra persica]